MIEGPRMGSDPYMIIGRRLKSTPKTVRVMRGTATPPVVRVSLSKPDVEHYIKFSYRPDLHDTDRPGWPICLLPRPQAMELRKQWNFAPNSSDASIKRVSISG